MAHKAGEKISMQEYRQLVGVANKPTSQPKRDQRWHYELDRHISFHPAIDRSDYRREYAFYPGRKFRFDFCFKRRKLAIEVQGILPESARNKGEKSAHQTFSGVTRDCEKQSLAATLGWRVIAVTQEQIKSGAAIQWIVDALNYQG